MVKNPPGSAGHVRDEGLIPGSGRSPGGEHGNLLQYSCLEHSMDRKAWQAMIHGGCKESDMTEQVTLSLKLCSTSGMFHVQFFVPLSS